MAAQKCKSIWLQAALTDFLFFVNPKLLLQDHAEQNARIGGFWRVTLVFK